MTLIVPITAIVGTMSSLKFPQRGDGHVSNFFLLRVRRYNNVR